MLMTRRESTRKEAPAFCGYCGNRSIEVEAIDGYDRDTGRPNTFRVASCERIGMVKSEHTVSWPSLMVNVRGTEHEIWGIDAAGWTLLHPSQEVV